MKALFNRQNAILLCIALFITLQSCSGNKSTTSQNNSNSNEARPNGTVGADTLATGLQNPWGMAFLPDGRVLITEKRGTLRIVENGVLASQPVSGVPAVFAQGQGGLLDVMTHPDYAQNGWIYMTYSKAGPDGTSSTTLARAKIQGNALTGVQELFTVKPWIKSGAHFGARIAFDGKGHVFLSTGERFDYRELAQDLKSHNGKIVRLNDDGTVPNDNPFVNTPNAQPEIWSYGHRNAQGLVYDAATGTLWEHEHGPRGGDEVNIIQAGKNYGWPMVSYGVNYDGSIVSNEPTKAGVENPLKVWTPSIAPCGMTIVTSDKYPGWKGSILSGALAGKHISRLSIQNNKVTGEEKLLSGIARVRDVKQAPDGYVYVLTESPGMFLRLRVK
jgi:glucose/arabinose dehydrogenase